MTQRKPTPFTGWEGVTQVIGRTAFPNAELVKVGNDEMPLGVYLDDVDAKLCISALSPADRAFLWLRGKTLFRAASVEGLPDIEIYLLRSGRGIFLQTPHGFDEKLSPPKIGGRDE